jgi:hypothetical protein
MKPTGLGATALTDSLPHHVYFLASAVFHHLGPAFAVLLFAHLARSASPGSGSRAPGRSSPSGGGLGAITGGWTIASAGSSRGSVSCWR